MPVPLPPGCHTEGDEAQRGEVLIQTLCQNQVSRPSYAVRIALGGPLLSSRVSTARPKPASLAISPGTRALQARTPGPSSLGHRSWTGSQLEDGWEGHP